MRRPAPLDRAVLAARTARAERILVALDFDGTLAEITERPPDAALPAETRAVLRELSAVPRVTVAVVSGRALSDLRTRVSGERLILAGNHGLEIEGGGIRFRHERAHELAATLDAFCWDMEALLEGVPGMSVERKGVTATVHYRQAPLALREWLEATVEFALAPYERDLRARPGRMACEILPRVAWDKGTALATLLRHLGEPRPLVVAIGDDATDEDMFRAAGDGVTIRVGTAASAARYTVAGPAEVREVLEAIVEAQGATQRPWRAAP